MIALLTTLLWLAGAWLVLACVTLAFVIPLCIAAKAGDEQLEAHPDIDALLDRLDDVEGPHGQRFFGHPTARTQLADELLALQRAVRR